MMLPMGVIKKAGVPILFRVFSIIISFYFWVILAGNATPSSVGKFSVLFSFIVIVSLVTSYGPGQYAIKEGDNFVHKEDYSSVIVAFSVFGAVISAVIVICLYAAKYFTNYFQQIDDLFILTILSVFSLSISSFISESFRGKKMFFHAVLGNGFLNILFFVLAIKYINFGSSKKIELNFSEILELFSVCCFFMAFIMFLMAKKNGFIFKPNCSKHYVVKQVIIFSSTASAVPVFMCLQEQVDIWLLEYFLNSEMVALYSIATKVARFSITPMILINIFIAPIISRCVCKDDYSTLESNVRACSGVAIILSSIIFVLFLLVGEEFLIIVFGEFYYQSYSPSIVLIIGQAFNVATLATIPLLVILGRAKYILYAVLFALVMKILFYYFASTLFNLDVLSASLISCGGILMINIFLAIVVKVKVGVACWPSLNYVDYFKLTNSLK